MRVLFFCLFTIGDVLFANAQLFPAYVGDNPCVKQYSEELYQKALSGNGDAQFDLAECYESARGVPFNIEEAIKWYQESAIKGNKKAIEKVADMYLCGIGVEQNYAKALDYYNMLQGDYSFQKGACYRGMQQFDNAIICFEESFKGSRFASVIRDCLYELYWTKPKEYEKKREKLTKSLLSSHIPVSNSLFGQCWFYGVGLSKDYAKAKAHLEMDTRDNSTGSPVSYAILGQMYLQGLGVEKNYQKAIDYLAYFENLHWAAPKHNLAIAQYLYAEELYKQEKISEAFDYAKAAAISRINPISHAMRLLANCYTFGPNKIKDEKQGKYWMQQAALNHDSKAIEIVSGL